MPCISFLFYCAHTMLIQKNVLRLAEARIVCLYVCIWTCVHMNARLVSSLSSLISSLQARLFGHDVDLVFCSTPAPISLSASLCINKYTYICMYACNIVCLQVGVRKEGRKEKSKHSALSGSCYKEGK